MSKTQPFFITAAAVAAPQKREPWFSVTAAAEGAELRLRGYIGEPSVRYSYYDDREIATGGMGTLKEFEDALTALGDVPLITVYLTSEGGDFPTAVAISSILARQTARIVCVIDGYAYSAAPVIACAADEVRAASNAIIMIHDAEFWCEGRDVAALQEAIKTLEACNSSMAAAFLNKAGGTLEEWQARMVATTWLTGAQAAELKLVDTLLDSVALSAYAPLKNVTAALRPPVEITALIDKSPLPSSPTPPISIMKPTPELITAAAAFGITLTAASTDADVATALTKIAAAKPAEVPPAVTAAAPLTLEGIQGAVTTAVKPLQDTITALEGRVKHVEGLKDHGIPAVTAAAPAPVTGAVTTPATKDTSKMTAMELIHLGRKNLAAAGNLEKMN